MATGDRLRTARLIAMRLATACSQRAESLGFAQLRDLLHRADQDFLANLLSLGVVAQPADGRGVDGPLVALGQLAKSLAVALCAASTRLSSVGSVSISCSSMTLSREKAKHTAKQ